MNEQECKQTGKRIKIQKLVVVIAIHNDVISSTKAIYLVLSVNTAALVYRRLLYCDVIVRSTAIWFRPREEMSEFRDARNHHLANAKKRIGDKLATTWRSRRKRVLRDVKIFAGRIYHRSNEWVINRTRKMFAWWRAVKRYVYRLCSKPNQQ